MSLQLYHQEEFKSMEISYLDGEQRQFLEDVLSRFLIYNKGILDQIPGWTISQRIPFIVFCKNKQKRLSLHNNLSCNPKGCFVSARDS